MLYLSSIQDIMYEESHFATLARWLYYGKKSPMLPELIPNSIPRISHFVWFNRNPDSPTELKFYQYITIMSALHVGGFHDVYVHGNR